MSKNVYALKMGGATKSPNVESEESQRRLDKFMLMEVLRGKLRTDRSPYQQHWYDVQRILDPHLVIWDMSNVGFPNFVSDILTSSKPLQAFDDLVAGLQSGITPAEQEWFRVGLEDEENTLAESESVQEYLHAVSKILASTLHKSNFYQQTPAYYRSGSRYLTACMFMEPDDEVDVRFTVLPIGSYYVSNNQRGLADTLCREFQMTVRQIIEKFCMDPITGEVTLDNVSDTVKNYWNNPQNREYRINIIHFVWPNPEFDHTKAKYDTKYKRYSSTYYELSENNSNKLLCEDGYDYFPAYVFRWFRQPTDAYGVDGPGFKAIGDINEMYEAIRMMLNAMAKVVEPPMAADPSVAGLPLGTTPAFLSIVPGGAKEGKFGPAYQIQPDIKAAIELIEDLKKDIEHVCMADIFRMLANKQEGEWTATEVLQRIKENTNILGPIFGNFNFEWLQPMIKNLYWLLLLDGDIPPAPPELQGVPLKIEMISTVAIALKMGEITAYKEFLDFAEKAVTVNKNVGDVINWDELIRRVSKVLNLTGKVMVGEDQVNAIRQARAQQAQQEQKMAQLEQAGGVAKNLAQAPTDQPNALTSIAKGA